MNKATLVLFLSLLMENPKGTEIRLCINKDIDGGKEAYRLTVTTSSILIEASAENGLFYGIQTLRQLIQNKKLPCLIINDKPAFAWRAYMLDEVRHFQGKETVKQLLEEMAMLKLNTFHWHLTDDTGWRIEIKKSNFVSDSLGKRMMGWNEILGINVHEWSTAENTKTELSPNAIVHFWKGAPDIMKHAII